MTRRILFGFFLFLALTGLIHAEENADEKLYPGNLLSVSLFGNKVISKDYRIDPQGFIQFPDAGQVNCNGQTLTSLRGLVIQKLTPIYKNASTISITKKSDDIYLNVLGLVKSPGVYLFSPNPSLQVVFQKAGGLGDGAQMNKIQVRHKGKITEIDYRKYLESGNEGVLPKLSSMDEVFVPSSNLISNISGPLTTKTEKVSSWTEIPTDKSVKIIGSVGKPGRYIWTEDASLLDLLTEAGGPTPVADTTNIRIISPKSKIIKFNLEKFLEQGGNRASLPSIKAGYTISVPELPRDMFNDKTSWTKIDQKTVIYVFGEVKKPGRYYFDNKLNFLDIISAADGPTEKADLHDVRVLDRQGPYPQVMHVNLALYFETGDPELIPPILTGDAVYVPQQTRDYTETNSKHFIKVLGEVAKPGRYRYTSNMTILDLLSAAGGPTSMALVTKIVVVNIGPNLESKASVFNLMKFSKTGDLRMLPTLREGDVVYIPNNNEDAKKKFQEFLQNIANVALIISSFRNGVI